MKQRLRKLVQGFTLLEVMISVGILALGLSTIFGSSVLAARSTAHARNVTHAAMLAQCRMTEVEAYLRQNQLPEADQNVEDPADTGGERCCEAPFSCVARVERIELPQPSDVSTRAGDRLLGAAGNAAQGQSFGGTPGGDGGVGAIGQLAGAMGVLGGGAADPTAALAGNGAPNMQGMAAELLTGIYPTLKPTLEGAIRKVTVEVRWHEGSREFGFDVVQYVTNPGQTLASGSLLDALNPPPGGTPPPTQPPPGGPR
jgi:prepilin-type N-terminal cleavage/methylation domain-containing protein